MSSRLLLIVVVAGLTSAGPVSFAVDAQSVDDVEAHAQEAWRASIMDIAPPAKGCFSAAYPSTRWEQVTCGKEPAYRSSPSRAIHKFAMHLNHEPAETAGNGTDYVAETSGLTRGAAGTFPTVTGVTSETGVGVAEYGDGGILGSNDYSLQLNTEVDVDSPAGCTQYHDVDCGTWQQFVYASNYGEGNSAEAFMQYWLFFAGRERCPRGWGNGGYSEGVQSCYKNSAAVTAPDVEAGQLGTLKLAGASVANGTDTLAFIIGTTAYTTTGSDSVLDNATTWNQSEFNVVGDAGGSEAVFNSGSSVTVQLFVNSGTTSPPVCLGPSNEGTTGESNNLNLGSCSASGGSSPSIQFTESN